MPVIAVGRTMAQKAYVIGKYAAENGNAATIKKFKASHDIEESTVRLINESHWLCIRIIQWVWSNVARTKNNY